MKNTSENGITGTRKNSGLSRKIKEEIGYVKEHMDIQGGVPYILLVGSTVN